MIRVKAKSQDNKIVIITVVEYFCEFIESCNNQYISAFIEYKKGNFRVPNCELSYKRGKSNIFLAINDAKFSTISVNRRNEILATKNCA